MEFDLSLWAWTAVFAISASVVVAAGIVLAQAGDAIATRTGLGGLFVGMLLMAAATSLPEVVTDVSAALAGAPDLAVGDLFGSSMANMAILAIIDLAYGRRVWPTIGLGHARLAAVAIGLTAFVLMAIVSPVRLQIGWIGLESLAVVAAYVVAAWWMRHPTGAPSAAQPRLAAAREDLLTPTGWGARASALPVRVHLLRFAAAAGVILISAPFVAQSAKGIAEETGIAQTFVGVTLLALATSLPELVASIAAVRIGAHDLTVGNLFESNAFNMTIVLFVDAAYVEGPVLAAVSPLQLLPGLGAVVLMAIALGAIVQGTTTRLRRGEPDAVLLLLAYVGLLLLAWNAAA